MNNKIRTAVFFKDYFESFFVKQSEKVQRKIIWTISLIEEIQNVPEKYLKHIKGTDGLYELRVQVGSNIYRIFCCFDEGKLVILMNAFQKKTQKTPKTEIEKALKIMKEYEQEK
ncbi:type II toxin-antitoxin system RelE/ParE family toxin [Reichenbachiella versicolor]|uniref:type II toxin-antitoxin system RelE/ParE family toxin n=1 Tax=Reichenbachiella versicolor TaxID=1821036 RepID=UPI000D6EA484|nr:type II toxin-antitoxin system RelE/ParE family toxin [Reichenbachiella versicolor]